MPPGIELTSTITDACFLTVLDGGKGRASGDNVDLETMYFVDCLVY